MRGLMMDTPLLVSSLIKHAAAQHAQSEIVSRTVEGPIHRYGYAQAHRRARSKVPARSSSTLAAPTASAAIST